MKTKSHNNTASIRVLFAHLIRIEQELDRIISEETDACPNMSSAFFTELKKLLSLRTQESPAAITLILSLYLPSKARASENSPAAVTLSDSDA